MTVPKRLSFSAQLSNCNIAACWHIELSILGLLHLSISIHLSNIVVLWNSFWAGLRRILPCLCKERKALMSTKACFRGKAFLGKPGACAMGTNTMALIQTCQIQTIMTVPERLSFPAQLSNCNVATWVPDEIRCLVNMIRCLVNMPSPKIGGPLSVIKLLCFATSTSKQNHTIYIVASRDLHMFRKKQICCCSLFLFAILTISAHENRNLWGESLKLETRDSTKPYIKKETTNNEPWAANNESWAVVKASFVFPLSGM